MIKIHKNDYNSTSFCDLGVETFEVFPLDEIPGHTAPSEAGLSAYEYSHLQESSTLAAAPVASALRTASYIVSCSITLTLWNL